MACQLGGIARSSHGNMTKEHSEHCKEIHKDGKASYIKVVKDRKEVRHNNEIHISDEVVENEIMIMSDGKRIVKKKKECKEEIVITHEKKLALVDISNRSPGLKQLEYYNHLPSPPKCAIGHGDGYRDGNDFPSEVIFWHNKYRKDHGQVGALRYSPDISLIAQSWADELAATGRLTHSKHTHKGHPLGENLYKKWGAYSFKGSEPVYNWYQESKLHNFKDDYQQESGHFSQIVWKGSRHIGIGKASGKDGTIYVVCNYFPAGNVCTEFSRNVFPASS